MSSTEPNGLPSQWRVDKIAGRGVDLRVSSSKRGYLTAGAAALAAFMGWKTLAHWGVLSGTRIVPWLGLTLLVTVLALWCAFGDEVWHLEQNCLVHRVGVGSWGYSRRYQDAELEIAVNFSTKFSVPYYRLYAVVSGKPHFLIERGAEHELQQLADFISFHTGWRIRS